MLNISILNKFACPDIHSWILDTVMILEPKLIAQAWIAVDWLFGDDMPIGFESI